VNIVFQFEGKVVLITGGATGIGRAAALAFTRHGAHIVIGDIDERGNETVGLIKEQGGRALFVKTDVSQGEQVKALVDKTVKDMGGLQCAFNNAGILPPTKPLIEIEESEFDKIVSVDLKGVFLSMKYEIEHMLKSGGGTIVNTASVAGLIADPGMSPYVAAKHGVVGLTKAAGIEYASHHVRINAIAPGLVETPMTKVWLDDPSFREMLISGIPAGRPAKPEEIADFVLFLSSPAASFAAGQTFVMDGGQIAH
jgi:NAD(P)-dependent dehydrogenase (short-subunit alcohol dehydrogenase family)